MIKKCTHINYPTSTHNPQSLRNVLFSLYSKGPLLSKAVNGQFFVPEELCHKIAYTAMMENIIAAMKTTPDLVGIKIKDDQLVFSGFLGNYHPTGIIVEEQEVSEYSEQEETQLPSTEMQEYSEQTQGTDQTPATPATEETPAATDEAETPAISVFLDYFINHCKTVSYIQLVSPETDNERYTMRSWFNQIGWKGIEDRPLRTYFYERLSGHTAFRTEENRQKWLENRKAEKEQRNNQNSQSIDECTEEPEEQQFAECEQPAEFESCSAAPECEQTAQFEENIVPEQTENADPECEEMPSEQANRETSY